MRLEITFFSLKKDNVSFNNSHLLKNHVAIFNF